MSTSLKYHTFGKNDRLCPSKAQISNSKSISSKEQHTMAKLSFLGMAFIALNFYNILSLYFFWLSLPFIPNSTKLTFILGFIWGRIMISIKQFIAFFLSIFLYFPNFLYNDYIYIYIINCATSFPPSPLPPSFLPSFLPPFLPLFLSFSISPHWLSVWAYVYVSMYVHVCVCAYRYLLGFTDLSR